ncbi:hypothetical protein CDD82_32 [Ophiocordyceps australis]|uniref:Ubiquitin-activating enzyme E1-like n=1 Tax=Ophiocordyceps australis TaxID=1399860 RepID=A0A2C5ZWS5_9HYPO|nr:hypothetical protein CDD82_32 [Ophiocordyceps australis]
MEAHGAGEQPPAPPAPPAPTAALANESLDAAPATVLAPDQQQPQQQQAASDQPTPLQQRPRANLGRDRYNNQSIGSTLNATIKKSRVLMVGAGGIGCELLKNLVLTGFGEIHIVDLDTIDLSNLNRQFLFRQEHIKKSKALVAKEVAQKFNPNVSIVAHNGNIKDCEFHLGWFRSFDMVFNALDNLDARRHVNKMSLAANIPLIESGTTGFNGQVQVIRKGVTACYDCTPKETPKSFPVCTIRSTPSQPIHCIVWAKSYLLNEVFGLSEDQSAFDHSSDADNAQEIEELKRESEALRKIREAVGTKDFAKMLFDKVFKKDIERLLSVQDMWKTRPSPKPLDFDMLALQASQIVPSKDKVLSDSQKTWSLEENMVVFQDSLGRLSKRFLQLKADKDSQAPEPIITFDKDDEDTLDFVAASANIRSAIFGIDAKSCFDIKQMAGNIIPAIATTNAVVAGICVLESLKVLKGEYEQSKEVFLTPFASARLLAPDRSRLPDPACPVCGVVYMSITADLARATLRDVTENIIKDTLGYGERDFVVSNDVGILYDADDDGNLDKKLSELGICTNSFLTVIDDDDNEPFVNVVINIEQGTLDDAEKAVRLSLSERPVIAKKEKQGAQDSVTQNGQEDGGQDGTSSSDKEPRGTKRGHDDDLQPTKRAKMTKEEALVVEDGSGAILIED